MGLVWVVMGWKKLVGVGLDVYGCWVFVLVCELLYCCVRWVLVLWW